jgi:hypothetical protein
MRVDGRTGILTLTPEDSTALQNRMAVETGISANVKTGNVLGRNSLAGVCWASARIAFRSNQTDDGG